MWFDVIYYVVNVAIVWWLAIKAFKNHERASDLAKLVRSILNNNDDLIAANLELLERLRQYEKHPSPFEKPFTSSRSGMGIKDNGQG